ncbi:hypothetical protein SG26_19280 (plasmid) [Haloarcula sp. CBA1115]|uniref:Uncharacterized protein n=1 Tax=Haloarcula amylolytica JCM 13557 TaxID=1227452 RepID=M0K1I4_9EURY|nr:MULTISPECIES: hypothetical protein [Haloarcula]AJF27911.1 hypothetical protein SG26_19280 [Haloarcula sp. CBA1115]EMA14643.1 hypothetical protein C442_20131 [Haloarcula amylolytica JCM 13557]
MDSTQTCDIDRDADIHVDAPLDREVIRMTETGFLAVCSDNHCSWQGLFPTREMAAEAVETHIERARRSPDYKYHFGQQNPYVVELIDDSTARICPDQELDLLEPWNSHRDGQRLSRSEATRTPLGEQLHRGDLIDCHGPGDAMVLQISQTRAFGLPAFSIIYVSPDSEPNKDGSYSDDDHRYLNNYVARNGEAVSVPMADRLSFRGQTNAQSDLKRWSSS